MSLEDLFRENKEKKQRELSDWEIVRGGGYAVTPGMTQNLGFYNLGRDLGQKEFYNDPDMQRLRALREEYAKGYSGEELGGIRQGMRGEIAGKQQAEQRALQSRMARGGVGGARAAAMQAAQGQQSMRNVAEAERKMALDSAEMKRKGSSDLQEFLFRQKLGALGMGTGFAQMGATDTAAQAAANANRKQNDNWSILAGILPSQWLGQ